MADFESEAEISITIPERELRSARQTLESGLSDIQTSVAVGGAGRTQQPRDPNTGQFKAIKGVEQRLVDQTSVLTEIRSAAQIRDDLLGNISGALQSSMTGGGGGGSDSQGRLARREHTWARQRTEDINDILLILENMEESGGGGGGDDGNFPRLRRLGKVGGGLLGGGLALGGAALVSNLSGALSSFSWPQLPKVNFPSEIPVEDPGTVTVADGETVGLVEGAAVPLASGAAVGLVSGAAVPLAASAAVPLVSDAAVGLVEGAAVALEEGATVELAQDTVTVEQNGAGSSIGEILGLGALGAGAGAGAYGISKMLSGGASAVGTAAAAPFAIPSMILGTATRGARSRDPSERGPVQRWLANVSNVGGNQSQDRSMRALEVQRGEMIEESAGGVDRAEPSQQNVNADTQIGETIINVDTNVDRIVEDVADELRSERDREIQELQRDLERRISQAVGR